MAYGSDDFRVVIRQRHAGQDFVNVNGIKTVASLTTLEIGLLVQEAWVGTNSIRDCQVQDVSYVQTEVTPLDGSAMTEIVPWDSGLDDTGAVVGDPVDPGSCLGFTLYSGNAGRSGRGRMYLGGVGRGALDAFSVQWDLTTSPGTTFKNVVQNYSDALASSDCLLSVDSRKNEVLQPVNAIVCRSSILSQNERARRYGVV